MKKLIILAVALSTFASCKKETPTPNSVDCKCGIVTQSIEGINPIGQRYYELTVKNNCTGGTIVHDTDYNTFADYPKDSELCLSKSW